MNISYDSTKPASYGAVSATSSSARDDVDNSRANEFPLKYVYLLGALMLLSLITGKPANPEISTIALAVENLQLNNQNSCHCINDQESPCKSLLLLRHAKSSWKNSFFVDDINRHLSNKGVEVAHEIGHYLHRMNSKLPDLILSSPSIRTEETLNIVLGEWILGAAFHDHKTSKKFNLKMISQGKHKKLNAKLKENNVGVEYVDALYTLSDQGYLQHFTTMMNNEHHLNSKQNRVLIVGHNPAMEKMLNELSPLSQQHFFPGELYEICFPGLASWADLKKTPEDKRLGTVSLILPRDK